MNNYLHNIDDIKKVYKEIIDQYFMEVIELTETDVELKSKKFSLIFLMQREGVEVDIRIGNEKSERLDIWCNSRLKNVDFKDVAVQDTDANIYGNYSDLRLDTICALMFYKKMFLNYIEPIIKNPQKHSYMINTKYLEKLIKTRITLIFFIGLIVGCQFDNTKQIEERTKDQLVIGVEEKKEQPKIDITTETRHAYIKELYGVKGEYFIVVDYANYFTGEEAAEMEWRDKTYMIVDGDTMTGITDGYYISNLNNRLRTFKLIEEVEINIFYTPKGTWSIEEERGATIEQLNETIEDNPLLILKIEGGVVTKIDEEFLP